MADANEIKKLLNDQTEEIQRHQKMLLEEFDHRLSVMAEVQGAQGEKVDSIGRKLDATMEMVATNTEQIETIKSLLKRRVDIDEYEKLEKRVGLLEPTS